MDAKDYITIPLGNTGKYAGMYEIKLDIEDADLAQFNWHVLTSKRHHTVYAIRSKQINKKRTHYLMHRVIMERILGRELKRKEHVDHINGIGCDNRRYNLRIATAKQNAHNQNKIKTSTTGYKGVTFQKGRYRARINVDGKSKHLGYFKTPELAHEAYCKAAKEHFGEFANTGD